MWDERMLLKQLDYWWKTLQGSLEDALPEKVNIDTAEVIMAFWQETLKNFILFIKKQLDYGSGNIARFGELGVMVRANDKIERLRTLLLENREAKNEPVEDTWRDLANYGVIGLLCHLGLWPEYKKMDNTDIDYSSTEWQDPNPPASP